MKPSEFIHPEDAAALRQLESIPGFSNSREEVLCVGLREVVLWNKNGHQVRLTSKLI